MLLKPRTYGLLDRVLAPAVFTTLLSTVVMGVFLFLFIHATHKKEGAAEIVEMSAMVQGMAPQMVWNYDQDALDNFGRIVMANDLLGSLKVIDSDGNVVFSQTRDFVGHEAYRVAKSLPLRQFQKDVGRAEVVFTTWPLIAKSLWQVVILLGGMGAVVIASLFVLRRMVLNELSPLVAMNRRMGATSEQMGADVAGLNEVVQRQQFSGKEISDAVGESSSSLSQLNDTLHQMTQTLGVLVNRTRASDELVHRLEGNSEKIQTILTTIVAIADSTNLLALNAAIEAARAGDAGRGFSVVADEVKKLSSKTVVAAREVEHIIAELKTSVWQVQQELSGMSDGIRSIESDMQQVAGASDRQSATMAEINSTLVQFLGHFRQTEDTIGTNMVRLNELMDAVDGVRRAITGASGNV